MNPPVSELQRRLCMRNHPHLATTGAVVPCGQHSVEGARLYGLVTPLGTHSFEVIRDMREEFGIAPAPAVVNG